MKVGEWKPGSGVNVTDVGAFYETSAANITLVVMTREVITAMLVSPFVQLLFITEYYLKAYHKATLRLQRIIERLEKQKRKQISRMILRKLEKKKNCL